MELNTRFENDIYIVESKNKEILQYQINYNLYELYNLTTNKKNN